MFQSPSLNEEEQNYGDTSLQQSILHPRVIPSPDSLGKDNIYAMGINDTDYNVGYKQKVQDYDEVIILDTKREAPELDWNNNPNMWSVIDSTLSKKVVAGVSIPPMRAPDINEGY